MSFVVFLYAQVGGNEGAEAWDAKRPDTAIRDVIEMLHVVIIRRFRGRCASAEWCENKLVFLGVP